MIRRTVPSPMYMSGPPLNVPGSHFRLAAGTNIGRWSRLRSCQGFVEHREALVELGTRDRQWRRDDEDVPVRHQVQTALRGGARDLGHRRERLARGVERHQRLPRLAILHELDAVEEAEAADLADRLVLVRQGREPVAEDLAQLRRVLDDVLLAERLDRRNTGRARKWMARVREPTGEVLLPQPVGDLLADRHRTEGHVTGADPLRQRYDVRHHVPVLAREPLASAPEASHHLVEDEQDSVPVA